MTLSEARWLSKCTVSERATDTEAALSLCAKCAGKAGAKLGCVKGSASSQILALGQGSLHPHPQPPHGPAIWEELLLLQQLLETTRRAGNTLRQPAGIRSTSQREYAPPANGWCWSPASRQRSHVQLSFPHCKLGLLGSPTADWVVDLSGPEQLPPAISANKRPLSSRVEQGTGVERAVLLLRN